MLHLSKRAIAENPDFLDLQCVRGNEKYASMDPSSYKLNNIIVVTDITRIRLDFLSIYHLDEKHGYRIHIFVQNLFIFDPEIMDIINQIHPNNKIYFHIHKEQKDFVKGLMHCKMLFPDHPNRFVEYDNPKKKITFRIPGYIDDNHCLVVKYEGDAIRVYLDFYMDTARDGYNIKPSGGLFQNYVQKKFPELFREELIERFKQHTPSSILKSFYDDQDIWDFITENGEWESKDVKRQNQKMSIDQKKNAISDLVKGLYQKD